MVAMGRIRMWKSFEKSPIGNNESLQTELTARSCQGRYAHLQIGHFGLHRLDQRHDRASRREHIIHHQHMPPSEPFDIADGKGSGYIFGTFTARSLRL